MEEMNLESILLPGIDPKRPIVIAGPCSAESEEQVLAKGSRYFVPVFGNRVQNREDSKGLVLSVYLG